MLEHCFGPPFPSPLPAAAYSSPMKVLFSQLPNLKLARSRKYAAGHESNPRAPLETDTGKRSKATLEIKREDTIEEFQRIGANRNKGSQLRTNWNGLKIGRRENRQGYTLGAVPRRETMTESKTTILARRSRYLSQSGEITGTAKNISKRMQCFKSIRRCVQWGRTKIQPGGIR